MDSDRAKIHDIQQVLGKAALAAPAGNALLMDSPDKAVIDRKAALERTMGDEQFLLDLLKEFTEGLSNTKDRIENAIDHQNSAAVRKEANRLAGAAGNLGAMELSDAASRLEVIGRKGCIEEANDAFHQLLVEADRLILHVRTYEFGNICDCAVS